MNSPKRTQAKSIGRNRIKLMISLLIIIIFICGGMFLFQQYQKYQMNRFDGYSIRGVSIGQQDGYVDFVALKNAGQNFVYLRATQGAIYSDDNFNGNYQRSIGSGINVGIYHVFSFDSQSKQQFKNFVTTVSDNTGNLPIAIQVSTGKLSKAQINVVKHFLNEISEYYPKKKIMIWSIPTVYEQLRDSKLLFWNLQPEKYRDCLVSVNNKQPIQLDGQKQLFHQVVFDGNKKKWQRDLLN